MEADILREITSSYNLKSLSFDELDILASNIRDIILDTVSKNGGHLASNLGSIELTIALHKVFDLKRDKIIFDVSHQTYTHKILTGRKDAFSTLRQYRGIAGYSNPQESPFDAFIAGHASTSLSVALGFIKARELSADNYEIVVVIGDGALTGGEAYEGLNLLGHMGKKVLVVLNDNEMSISKNVGAVSKFLSHLRTSKSYQYFKRITTRTRIGQKIKLSIKELLLPTTFFEEFGFTYLGPIDGHNLKELAQTFERSKNIPGPTLVHVITKKGKGYKFAEESPTLYHSVEPFNLTTGIVKNDNVGKTFSDYFGEILLEEGEKDPRIFVITAAMTNGTKTEAFKEKFPSRFIDVGIAEQTAVTAAATLAKNGFKPVVAIYSTFLQRAYDQLVHDVGILGLPVIFILDRAGVVSDDGPTHQGIFDMTYLRSIPNFVVAAPKDGLELKELFRLALLSSNPFVIRFPKDYTVEPSDTKSFEIGKGELVFPGNDLLLISIGAIFERALKAREILEKKMISTALINARFVRPLDVNLIQSEALRIGRVITIEDNILAGGFGSAVNEILSISGVRVMNLGINDVYPEQGKRSFLLDKYGLSPELIAETGERFAKEKNR